jgi:LPS sulfotransferase NodH
MTIDIEPTAKKYDFTGQKVKQTHIELFEHLMTVPDSLRPPRKSLLILGTPRCGSTLFAQALNQSFRLGMCDEWLNYDYFRAYCKVTGLEFDLEEYLEFVKRKTTKGNGVFCLKWHIHQLVAMNKDFKFGVESMFFDHIIYLYRRDKIAQAVSFCKAITSNQYRSYEPEEKKPLTTLHGIASSLEHITRHDQWAREYLLQYTDAEYAYEDFRVLGYDAHSSYNKVLAALGVDPVLRFTAGELKKQANQQSKEAINDFKNYLRGGSNEEI